MVAYGLEWWYSGKSGFTGAKIACIWAKWLYSSKVVVFGKKVVVFWAKVVAFGQSGGIQAKMVVFDKSGFNRANLLHSGKRVLLG